MTETKILKEEVKKEWVEALRSGEYKQTQYYLKDTEGYCCLGVLTDLCVKSNSTLKWEHDDEQPYSYIVGDGTTQVSYPPKTVEKWACTVTDKYILCSVWQKLSYLNDSTVMSFEEIALLIEKEF